MSKINLQRIKTLEHNVQTLAQAFDALNKKLDGLIANVEAIGKVGE
mgnify:FL=1